MATEEEPERRKILGADTVSFGVDDGETRLWLASTFAPDWFKDSAHEAASSGRDARRREIIFAVCCAESYLLEWVRDEALNQDFARLEKYFKLGDGHGVRKKWKEVPKQLHTDRLVAGHPDYGKPFWQSFDRLVDYRNGLVHAGASRPDSNVLAPEDKAKPEPTPHDLEAMPQGWPTRVVVALVRELHASVGTTSPTWLVDPPCQS
jgi:hypothetical protein